MEQHYGWTLLGLIYFGGVWFAITRPSIEMLEQTPDKLAFCIRPTFFWGVEVFLGGIGLISLLFTLTLTPITTLTCNRAALQLPANSLQDASTSTICELVGVNWLSIQKSKTFISELQEAIVETKITEDSDGRTTTSYRVALRTSEGNVPFTADRYTADDYESRQILVSQINNFVEDPLETSLAVQEDDRLLGYTGFAVGGFFLLLCFLLMAVLPVITCTFDKKNNSVSIRRKSCFAVKESQHSLNEISAVKVEHVSGDEGSTYRVLLTLNSGEKLPLTRFYTSGFEDKQYVANCIRRFLSLSCSRV